MVRYIRLTLTSIVYIIVCHRNRHFSSRLKSFLGGKILKIVPQRKIFRAGSI